MSRPPFPGAWIGVDFDGVLVTEPANLSEVLITGTPIRSMIERVKGWLAEGKDVRIFTARVGPATAQECVRALAYLPNYERSATPQLDWLNYQRTLLERWCQEHLGRILPLTCEKDLHLLELWDDRCVQLMPNTGQTQAEYLAEIHEREQEDAVREALECYDINTDAEAQS